jgi:hypothetical protein
LNFANDDALPARKTSVDLGVAGPLQRWNTSFLFDYDIFPSSIMRFQAEWMVEGRPMQVGDVIVQRAVFPPVGFGICLEFAVRVSAIFREPTRLGFAYQTLMGHVESGTSEFYFEQSEDQIRFTIHTRSEPGHWTSRAGKDWLTLPYQAWCTRQAIAHVQRRFRDVNPVGTAVSDAELR